MNYRKIASKYRKEALLALQKWIQCASPYDESTIRKDAPYGEGVRKSLRYFGELGRKNGFAVDYCDGYCTELTFGEKGPLIGIYGHGDVVPAGEGWKHKPYAGTYEDGVIYGRGATDDKGPMIAAFYATKALKDLGLIDGFRVKIVCGGDEERGSSCLKHYFGKHKGEAPSFGFTPDSDWPLIYGEKGMRGYELSLPVDLSPIVAMEGGSVSNAVCDSLLVTMEKNPVLEKALASSGLKYDDLGNDVLTMVRFKGKSAHGSTPELGENAAGLAFRFLEEALGKKELQRLGEIILSPDGAIWGGAHSSKELGKATYNFGVVRYDAKGLRISLDFRFGEEADPDALIRTLKEKSGMEAKLLSEHHHLLFDKKSPLVKTLLSAYRMEARDFFAKPLAIGGGTYAKEAPNTVAFGACFKGRDGNMHGAEEYMLEKDFLLDIAIYMRAILALGKKAR